MGVTVEIFADTAEKAREEMRKLLGDDRVELSGPGPDPDDAAERAAVAAREAEQRIPPSEGGPAITGGAKPLPPTKKTVEFAEENGIDLGTAKVEGTGKNGRITKADVERYVAEHRTAGAQEPGDEPGGEEQQQQGEEPSAAPEPSANAADVEEIEMPDPEDGDPTLEQARAALMGLNEVTNLQAAQAMVKRYGAPKIQEVDPKRYRAFINDCNQAIRQAKAASSE